MKIEMKEGIQAQVTSRIYCKELYSSCLLNEHYIYNKVGVVKDKSIVRIPYIVNQKLRA